MIEDRDIYATDAAFEPADADIGTGEVLIAQVGAGSGMTQTGVPDEGASATSVIVPNGENRVRLSANVSIENIQLDGDDLLLIQPDGSQLRIVGGALNVPTFIIDDLEVPREALLAALETNGFNVAAGPNQTLSVTQQTPAGSGGQFEDFSGPSLAGDGQRQLLDLLGDDQTNDQSGAATAFIEPIGEAVATAGVTAGTVGETTTATNAAPVVASIAQTNLAEQTNTSTLTAAIAVSFTDVDLADTGHTVRVTAASASGVTTGLALNAASLIALVSPGAVTKASGSPAGSVTLGFSAVSKVFDYLAEGEVLTLTYTLAIDDGDGGVASRDFVVTITGTNDAPEISAIAQVDINEQTDTSALTAAIEVGFTDIDLADTGHTARVTAASASGVTRGLSLDADGLMELVTPGTVTKASGSTAGSVTLDFSAGSTAFDYLAVGEVLTLTYTLAVDDGDGGVTTREFVVAITGTNDAPVVAAEDVTGGVTEPVTAAGDLTDSGTIAFTDADLSDTHAILPGIVASEGALGVLQASVTADTDGTGTGGIITWNYQVAASAVKHLAAGETKVETFTLTLDDGKGGTVVRTVSVTVTGTNDAPVVSVEPGAAQVEAADARAQDIAPVIGNISVTDADLGDTLTARVDGAPVLVWSGGTLSAQQIDALTAALAADRLTLGGAIASNGGAQSIGYSWDPAAADLDFLAAGQTLTVRYEITVSDGTTASAVQPLTFTITGTNDVPVAVIDNGSDDAAFQMTEDGGLAIFDVRTNDRLDPDAGASNAVTLVGGLSFYGLPSNLTESNVIVSVTADNQIRVELSGPEWNQLASGQTGFVQINYRLHGDNGDVASSQLLVQVSGVNDAPVLNVAIDPSMTIAEDAVLPGLGGGTAVSELVGRVGSGGPDNVSDDNGMTGLAIVGLNTSNGTWYFSIDNGLHWSAIQPVSDTHALTLRSDARLAFVPAADYVGVVTDALTFRAWDGNGGYWNASVNGGTTGYSSATDTVSLSVTSSNDAPVIISGAQAGTITERVDVPNGVDADPVAATGTIVFRDVDRSGDHSASITSRSLVSATLPDGISLTSAEIDALLAGFSLTDADLSNYSTMTGEGSTGWTYQIGNAAIDRLGVGQRVTLAFEVTISDGAGGSAVETVAITINGTDDRPVAVLDYGLTDAAFRMTEDDGAKTFDVLANDTLDPDFGAPNTLSVGLVSVSTNWLGLTAADVHATVTASGIQLQLLGSQWDKLTAGSNVAVTVNYSINGDQPGGGSASQLVVRVDGVNDAPVLDASKSPDMGAITEGTGRPVGAVGVLVSSLLDSAAISGGYDNVSDDGFLVGMALTGTSAGGTWYWSPDAGTSWIAISAVSDTNALLLRPEYRLAFQPSPEFSGQIAEAITFRAWDGTGTPGQYVNTSINGGTTGFSSATDTASLTVTAVNDAPVLSAVTGQSVAENAAGALVATFTVADIDTASGLAFRVLDGGVEDSRFVIVAANGTVLGQPGIYEIRLGAGQSLDFEAENADGMPTIIRTIEVNDGAGANNLATSAFTITVTDVPEGPTATDDRGTTNEDTPVTLTVAQLTANDVNPVGAQPLTITGVSGAVNGTVSLAGGIVTFTPAANFSGQASFTYTLDNGAATDTATVTIDVSAVNDAPVMSNLAPVVTGVEQVLSRIVEGIQITDVELDARNDGLGRFNGSTLYVGQWDDPEHQFSIDAVGASFTFDGTYLRLGGDIFATVVKSTGSLHLSFSDPSAVDVTSALAHEVFDRITYANMLGNPPASTVLRVLFTDGGSIGQGTGGQLTVEDFVTVNITPVNDAPVLSALTGQSVAENAAGALVATFTVADIDTASGLAFRVLDGGVEDSRFVIVAANGTAFGQPGTYEIRLASGQSLDFEAENADGQPTIIRMIEVNDGSGANNLATSAFTITVTDVPEGPTANDDRRLTNEDTAVTFTVAQLTANDVNPAGAQPLTITGVSGAVNGTVSLNGSIITFTPAANFSGQASFTYTLDNGAARDTATVTIDVAPVADAPVISVALNDMTPTVTGAEFEEDIAAALRSFTISLADTDGSESITSVVLSGFPAGTTFSLGYAAGDTWVFDQAADIAALNAGTVMMTPPANYNGTFTLTVTADVTDTAILSMGTTSSSTSSSVTLAVTVAPVNDAPTFDAIAGSVAEDGPSFSADLLTAANADDVDGDTLTIVNPDGSITTADGRVLTLGTHYTVTGANFALTPTGLALFNTLAQGQTDAFTFNYAISDGTVALGNSLTVTINGTDDRPVAVLDYGLTDAAFRMTEDDGAKTFDVLANDTLDPDFGAPNTLSVGLVSVSTNWLGLTAADVQATVTASGIQLQLLGSQWDKLTAGSNVAVTVNYSINGDQPGGGSASQLVVRVDGVNDAPVLDASKSPDMGAITEGTGRPVGAVGVLVSSLLDSAAISGGYDNVSDDGFLVGMALTGTSAGGTWYWSPDAGTSWIAISAVSDTNALLLRPEYRLAFQPSPEFSGQIAEAITFRAWDGTGTPGQYVNTSINGGTTGFSSATDTASLTVTAVNDAPVLSAVTGQSVAENAAGALVATFTVADIDTASGLAFRVLDGGVEDSRFVIVAANGTVLGQPGIYEIRLGAGQSLDFEAENADGMPTIIRTIEVNDGAGANNLATSAFTITVTDVPEGPTATDDRGTTNEDTPVTLTVAQLTANDVNPVGAQPLTITGVSGAVNGTVSLAGGIVTFTPAANFSGQASFTYTLDNGAATDTATVTIDVAPVADAPVVEFMDSGLGRLFFSATNGTNGYELWSYDGTNPPVMVHDINVGGGDSNAGRYGSLIEFGGKIYFSATNGTNGYELWSYDGTNPPVMVHDIRLGSGGSSAGLFGLTEFDGKLYFSANDGTNGAELWSYDGINPPTMVHDINVGSGSSSAAYYGGATEFGGKLYFSATNGTNGYELWSYDGTNPPTMVHDLNPGNGSSGAGQNVSLIEFAGKLYFSANDGTNGYELWSYDGTNPPTMVHDINPGDADSYAGQYGGLIEFDGKLYFSATDGTSGYELWSYDGTNPPILVFDIHAGVPGSFAGYYGSLIEFDGKLYFSATDETRGYELWSYDGTNPPTLVFDIRPGVGGSYAGYFASLFVFGGKLYFSADDGTHGIELWSYDGTNSPVMVQDIRPGSASSDAGFGNISNFDPAFAALIDSGVSGAEDTAIAVPVSVALADTDGSETLTALTLSGVPVGATISDGANSVTSTGAAISILGWNLADLAFRDAPDASGTFTLTLTATVTDTATLSSGVTTDTRDFTHTIPVTVTTVNDAPVLSAVTGQSVAENAAGALVATFTVADIDTASGLAFRVLDGGVEDTRFVIVAAGGTVFGQPGIYEIRLASGQSLDFEAENADGMPTIIRTIEVNDGAGANNLATSAFTITVTDVPEGPTATDDSGITVNEDMAVTLTVAQLTANDVNPAGAQPLTITGVSGAVNGTVSLVTGIVTFTPAANFSGQASFTYTLDNGAATDTATVTIDVVPVADGAVVTVGSNLAATPAALTGDLIVNTTTGGTQRYGSVSALSGGGYVVAWNSDGQDGWGIYAQRFSAAGVPVGGETRVTTTQDNQLYPATAGLADGGYVVTWTSFGNIDASSEIYAQAFNADGTPRGGEVLVNTNVSNAQLYSAIAAIDGGYVVTWTSLFQNGSADLYDIYAQRFFNDGSKNGGEIRVNSSLPASQQSSAVAAIDGGYVVVWESDDQDGSGIGIYGQRFDASGNKAGGEFLVNTTTAGDQFRASIAGIAGGFVVAWYGDSAESGEIYMQRYDAAGNRVGSETRVNATTTGAQGAPTVTASPDGYIVSWNASDGGSSGIFAQRFAADGTPIGAEFRLNDVTTGNQTFNSQTGGTGIAVTTDGALVAIWDNQGLDVGQRVFRLPEPLGGEAGTAIAITPVTVTLPDSSETISAVSLAGVPSGFVLTDGTRSATSTGAAVDLTGWTLSSLVLTPPSSASGTFALTLSVTTSDTATLSSGSVTDTETVTVNFDVTVTAVNDPPTLTGLDNVTFVENIVNAAPQIIDANVVFADSDSADLSGGTLTVSGFIAGQDTIGIRNQGTGAGQIGVSGTNISFAGAVIGTFTGGSGANNLVVTFNASATPTAVDALIQNLTYANSSDTPTATRTLTITVTDGDGGSVSATSTISVTAENEPPVGAHIARSYSEDARGFFFLPFSATDPDSSSFTYSNIQHVSGPDVRTAPIGSANDADPRTFDFVIWDNYDYLAAGQTAQAVYSYAVSDAQATGTGSVTITINGVNDAPTLTGDRAATMGQGATYVLGATDLGFTDVDDGAADVVFSVSSLVNGAVWVAGSQVNSFTGAQLAAGSVEFRHNGSAATSASFNVSVEDGNEDGSAAIAQAFSISVTPSPQTAVADHLSSAPLYWQVWEVNGHAYGAIVPDAGRSPFTHVTSLLGGAAYVATITSEGENAFVLANARHSGYSIIGGSDGLVEGTWRWIDGPEFGTQFWSGGANGSAFGGAYAPWASGEPNNGGGGEDYVILVSEAGANYGKWVDIGARTGEDGRYIAEAGRPGSLYVPESVAGQTSFLANILLQNDTGSAVFSSVSSTSTLGASLAYNAVTGRITYDAASVNAVQALTVGQSIDDTFTYQLANGATGTVTMTIRGVNDGPTLTGLDNVTFLENTVNAAPQIIDANVVFMDLDSANLDSGRLTVSGFITGQDTIGIRDQGAGAGNITLSGLNVLYSGTVIGTIWPGSGLSFLEVSFNANATPAAVDALLQNLTFANSSNTPTATRTLTITVTDGDGGTVSATSTVTVTAQADVPLAVAANDVIAPVPAGWTWFADNGHIYKYVGNETIWSNAVTNAAAEISGQSYLATSTSSAEDAFIDSLATGRTHLGASDQASEGTWKWTTGPEAGQVFWIGGSNGAAQNGAFTNWSTDNPGNLSGTNTTENYLATDVNDNWNDVDGSNSQLSIGYTVEAGGLNGQSYATITEDAPFTFSQRWLLANDANATGNIVSVSPTSTAGATVSYDAVTGQITYDARTSASLQAMSTGQTQADTFTYTINDGNGGTSTATVTVMVQGINDPSAMVSARSFAMVESETDTQTLFSASSKTDSDSPASDADMVDFQAQFSALDSDVADPGEDALADLLMAQVATEGPSFVTPDGAGDVFVLDADALADLGSDLHDLIADYATAEGDVIDLSALLGPETPTDVNGGGAMAEADTGGMGTDVDADIAQFGHASGTGALHILVEDDVMPSPGII